MQGNRNEFVFKVCILCVTCNFLYQLQDLESMLKGEFYFGVIYQWTAFFILIGLMIKYFRGDKQAIYPLIHVLTIRQSIAMIDFEGRRFRIQGFRLFMFSISQVYTVFLLLFCINFISENKKHMYFGNIVNFTFTVVGMLIINQQEKFSINLTLRLLYENLGFVLTTYVAFGIFLYIIMRLFENEKKEILKACY